MPYSPEHKRDTREKILESARRLFNKKGFSEVSIDEPRRQCESNCCRWVGTR
jgi:TetR/AcrR family transcriptional repressor of nem operon